MTKCTTQGEIVNLLRRWHLRRDVEFDQIRIDAATGAQLQVIPQRLPQAVEGIGLAGTERRGLRIIAGGKVVTVVCYLEVDYESHGSARVCVFQVLSKARTRRVYESGHREATGYPESSCGETVSVGSKETRHCGVGATIGVGMTRNTPEIGISGFRQPECVK